MQRTAAMLLSLLLSQCNGTGLHGEDASGIEPCGELMGEVNIRSVHDAEEYACYTSIEFGIQINANDGLTHFEMPHLREIGASLRIVYNYDLVNFDLKALEYVRGRVEVRSNNSLPSVDGLSGLKYIGGDLKIFGYVGEENHKLCDINGLSSLESVSGDIQITNNPKIPTCAAEELVEQLTYFPGIATIDDNDSSASCD